MIFFKRGWPWACILWWACLPLGAQGKPSYDAAESLIKKGEWQQALGLLNPLIAQNPNDAKALNLKGLALTGEGQRGLANKAFQKAFTTEPTFYPALKNIAINEAQDNNLEAAEKHFRQALALAPQDPVCNAYLGAFAFSRQEFASAISLLEKAGPLLTNPDLKDKLIISRLHQGQTSLALADLPSLQGEALSDHDRFLLGAALAQDGLYAQGVPFLQAVSKTQPASSDVAFDLALCYEGSEDYSGAIQTLNAYMSRERKTAEMLNLLAESYEKNQEPQKAIDALREATMLQPEVEDNYVDLAELCTRYDAYDIGLQVIDVALQHHPKSGRLIFDRGVLEAMKDQFDKADQDFQLAKSLAPEKSMGSIGMSMSFLQTGKLDEAIGGLRTQLKADPNNAILQYLFGEALVRAGARVGDPSFTEANAALEKSVRLDPTFAAAQVALANLLVKQSQFSMALGHLEQARAADPKDKAAYSQLAVVYRHLDRAQDAENALAALNRINEDERKNDHRLRMSIGSQPQ
jgi:tetratricopeptide (TPR) repeat protein